MLFLTWLISNVSDREGRNLISGMRLMEGFYPGQVTFCSFCRGLDTQSGSGARGLLLVTRPGDDHGQGSFMRGVWLVNITRCWPLIGQWRDEGQVTIFHLVTGLRGTGADTSPQPHHTTSNHSKLGGASSRVQANFLLRLDDKRVSDVVSATEYCLLLWAIITSVTTSHVFTACNWIQ